MKKIQRSPEYKARVRHYVLNVKERHGADIGNAFMNKIEAAEGFLLENCLAFPLQPYIIHGEHVLLREYPFKSGPATYCTIYDVRGENIRLATLWHGEGSRQGKDFQRVWPKD